MSKRHSLTPKKADRFFDLLREGYTVSHACNQINISRAAMYKARSMNPQFAKKWDDAIEAGTDILEDEARRRAIDGVEEPVFGSGGTGVGTVEVGSIRKYSDTLLIFLLKGRRPERFRDNMKVTIDNDDLDKEIERRLAQLADRSKAKAPGQTDEYVN